MLAPSSNKAPAISGAKSDLLELFERFEHLAKSNGLDDEEKCESVTWYVNQCTKRFWDLLPGYEDYDYKKFKESILAEFPGVEKGAHYHVRDLDRLIKKYAASGMTTTSCISPPGCLTTMTS